MSKKRQQSIFKLPESCWYFPNFCHSIKWAVPWIVISRVTLKQYQQTHTPSQLPNFIKILGSLVKSASLQAVYLTCKARCPCLSPHTQLQLLTLNQGGCVVLHEPSPTFQVTPYSSPVFLFLPFFPVPLSCLTIKTPYPASLKPPPLQRSS